MEPITDTSQGSQFKSDPAFAERMRQLNSREPYRGSGNPLTDFQEAMQQLRDLRSGAKPGEIIPGEFKPVKMDEEHIYSLVHAGLLRPDAADKLIFYVDKARKDLAEGKIAAIEIITASNQTEQQRMRERMKAQAVETAICDARIPPHMRRANFETDEDGHPLTVTDGNARALKFCQVLAEGWTPNHKGLTLCGPAGRGKTYLAIATLIALIRKHGPGINGRYITERDLLQMFRESYQKRQDDPYTPSTFRLREWFMVRPQVLVLDDLGTETPASGEKGDWARGQILDLIDYRSRERLTTIVTTNLSDRELVAMYDDRIASRLYGHSPMITIQGGDWRQKVRPDDDDPFWSPQEHDDGRRRIVG